MLPASYYADLSWKENTPISTLYNDVYYSSISGINETNYVFLEHNQLAKRFLELKDNEHFIIAETGFGSGLNFLATLNLWRSIVKTKAKLFFISFEKHPLKPIDLEKTLSNFPTLAVKELLEQYYLPLQSGHRLYFAPNVYLNLVIGDIKNTLNTQNFIANAWYLDGFTPTKNIDMWNISVIEEIARHSSPGTTFATFSANSMVRKLLIHHGFMVHKDKGFAKREMLYGEYTTPLLHSNDYKPWFSVPKNTTNKIIIIGCGISGAATAYSLAKRGYDVTIYEKANELDSGNDQMILYGNFSGNYTPLLEISYSGYRYSHNLIKSLLTENVDYQACGVIQLAHNQTQLAQQQKILASSIPKDFCYHIDNIEIERIAGIKIDCNSGLYYPYGVWLNPTNLIKQLLRHSNIKLVLNSNITDINYTDKWYIKSNNTVIDSSSHLVLCNSHQLQQFKLTANLPIIKTRGQISKLGTNLNLKSVICGKAYITPYNNRHHTLGATFKTNVTDSTIINEEHIENINAIQSFIPHLYSNYSQISGYANIRASCQDYLPMVGPVADYIEFKSVYQALAKDAKIKLDTSCPYLPGLYLNVAHGSKGVLTAPFCGEIIADYIDNTPFAISVQLRQALHPNRFWVKEISKSHSF